MVCCFWSWWDGLPYPGLPQQGFLFSITLLFSVLWRYGDFKRLNCTSYTAHAKTPKIETFTEFYVANGRRCAAPFVVRAVSRKYVVLHTYTMMTMT